MQPVALGIIGLGRWANVLAKAAAHSDKIKIIAGYSRTEEKRLAFAQKFGVVAAPDIKAFL